MSRAVMRLASACRRARLARGLSQYELAEKVGVDHELIRRFEAGEADPRWSTVVRLVRALNLSLEKAAA